MRPNMPYFQKNPAVNQINQKQMYNKPNIYSQYQPLNYQNPNQIKNINLNANSNAIGNANQNINPQNFNQNLLPMNNQQNIMPMNIQSNLKTQSNQNLIPQYQNVYQQKLNFK